MMQEIPTDIRTL